MLPHEFKTELKNKLPAIIKRVVYIHKLNKVPGYCTQQESQRMNWNRKTLLLRIKWFGNISVKMWEAPVNLISSLSKWYVCSQRLATCLSVLLNSGFTFSAHTRDNGRRWSVISLFSDRTFYTNRSEQEPENKGWENGKALGRVTKAGNLSDSWIHHLLETSPCLSQPCCLLFPTSNVRNLLCFKQFKD